MKQKKTENPPHGSLVDQINAYMDMTGRRQYEVAAEIGAPVQTVNRWLNGKAKISKAYQRILIDKRIVIDPDMAGRITKRDWNALMKNLGLGVRKKPQ